MQFWDRYLLRHPDNFGWRIQFNDIRFDLFLTSAVSNLAAQARRKFCWEASYIAGGYSEACEASEASEASHIAEEECRGFQQDQCPVSVFIPP